MWNELGISGGTAIVILIKFPFIGKSLRTKNLANVCQADF